MLLSMLGWRDGLQDIDVHLLKTRQTSVRPRQYRDGKWHPQTAQRQSVWDQPSDVSYSAFVAIETWPVSEDAARLTRNMI